MVGRPGQGTLWRQNSPSLWGLPDRLLHCGISVASAARFMAEMGHKPAYLSPRRAGGMSAMPTIVSDFAALQRRKCSARVRVG